MGYWTVAVVLIAYGIAGAMTIGRPFFLIGLAMLVLGPVRHRPRVFWPPLLGLVAYNIAFWTITPFYCSATSVVGGPSTTTCSSLIGIPWPADSSGVADPGAAFVITNLVGVVVGIAVFAAVLFRLSRSRAEGDAAP
jgi:hypothetical protein